MHLAVLLFLTGVAFAYPLMPAQESQLVPRDRPQGHCFRPLNGEQPALNGRNMYMGTCEGKGGVGWIEVTSTSKSVGELRNLWKNGELGDPPECLLPQEPFSDKLGHCFVLRSKAGSTANQSQPAAAQKSQHPAPQAPHQPASTTAQNGAHSKNDFPTAKSWSGLTYPSSGKQ